MNPFAFKTLFTIFIAFTALVLIAKEGTYIFKQKDQPHIISKSLKQAASPTEVSPKVLENVTSQTPLAAIERPLYGQQSVKNAGRSKSNIKEIPNTSYDEQKRNSDPLQTPISIVQPQPTLPPTATNNTPAPTPIPFPIPTSVPTPSPKCVELYTEMDNARKLQNTLYEKTIGLDATLQNINLFDQFNNAIIATNKITAIYQQSCYPFL